MLCVTRAFYIFYCRGEFRHLDSPLEGRLGCFWVLTITNKTAVNIHIQGFL